MPVERLTLRVGSETRGLGEGSLAPGESVTADVSADAEGSVTVLYAWPNADARSVVADA